MNNFTRGEMVLVSNNSKTWEERPRKFVWSREGLFYCIHLTDPSSLVGWVHAKPLPEKVSMNDDWNNTTIIDKLFEIATELAVYRQGSASYKAAEQKLEELKVGHLKNG